MNPQKCLTIVGRKREKGRSRSKEGIFLVKRRKHPRLPIDLPLDYFVESTERHGGVAANASRSGLLVYLPEPIFVGSQLKIELLFVKGSGLNSIAATAKVVWSDLAPNQMGGEYRYGLKFESFKGGDLRKLRKLLTEVTQTRGR